MKIRNRIDNIKEKSKFNEMLIMPPLDPEIMSPLFDKANA